MLASEISGLQKSNVSPLVQPEAAAILAQAKGILGYENKHFNDYVDWKTKNPNAPTDLQFQRDWVNNNRLNDFVDKAGKNIAYKGQAVPRDQAKLVDGQAYMTSKGVYRWNAATGKFDKVAQ